MKVRCWPTATFGLPALRALLGALLLAVAAPLAAQEASVGPERIAAAKDLMEVTGVTKQMDGMIAAMGQGFRKGASDAGNADAAEPLAREFDSQMQRLMTYRQAMLEDFAVLYAQRFTAQELKEVADFYRSPTGQKFIQAVPELMQAGAQVGMKYSQKAIQAPAEPGK